MNSSCSVLYGHKWYRYFKAQQCFNKTGLLDEYHLADLEKYLIVHLALEDNYQKNNEERFFTVFSSPEEFLEYQEYFLIEYRGFYETILGQSPQKPHFDIDIKTCQITNSEDLRDNGNKVLNSLVSSILEVFQDFNLELDLSKDLLLFSSHGPEKVSYHVVIDNYYHGDHREAKAFYKLVLRKIPQEYRDYVDPGVYSSLQQFRLLGSQKFNSGRPKIFVKEWMRIEATGSSKITNHLNEDSIFIASLVSKVRGVCLPNFVDAVGVLFGSNPKTSMYFSQEEIDQALELLSQSLEIPLDSPYFPFEYTKDIENWIILKRLSSSYCQICNREHDKENPFLSIVGQDRRVYFNCRRHELGKSLCLGTLKGGFQKMSLDFPDEDEDLLETLVIPTVNKEGKIINESSSTSILKATSSLNESPRLGVTFSSNSLSSKSQLPTKIKLNINNKSDKEILLKRLNNSLPPSNNNKGMFNNLKELNNSFKISELNKLAQGQNSSRKNRPRKKKRSIYQPPVELVKSLGI